MISKKLLLIIGGIVVALVIIGALFFSQAQVKQNPQNQTENQDQNTSSDFECNCKEGETCLKIEKDGVTQNTCVQKGQIILP